MGLSPMYNLKSGGVRGVNVAGRGVFPGAVVLPCLDHF